MKINHAMPAPALRNSFSSHFGGTITTTAPHLLRVNMAAGTTEPSPFDAIPVYRLGLKDIGATGSLDRLSPVTWLAWSNLTEHPDHAIELTTDRATLHAILETGFVQEISAALAALAKAPGVDSLTASFLLVEALHIRALWMRGSNRAADIVIPLGMAFPPLVVGKHYEMPAFLGAIENMADVLKAATPNTIG
jgi:hypothetical protein